jgi:hypothetical protein
MSAHRHGVGSALVNLAVVALMGCGGAPSAPTAAVGPAASVPTEVAGWRVGGELQVFDSESIYEYIDGHAEVYLAYGMKRCLSWRYSGPQGEPSIVLDLFELASAADAYGVFTHDREGEAVSVGQAALLRPGWLSFWKGSWFGSVYAEGESERAEAAMLEIAAAAAGAITEEGAVPALVAELPEAGLDPRSVRFFRTQEILNSVVYLGFDNVLNFGPEIDAVIGHYRRDSGEGWLLLVEYPDAERAAEAEARGLEAGLPVRRTERRLAGVLAPQPAAVADELLGGAVGGG